MIVKREFIPIRTLILRGDKAGKLFIKLGKQSYPKDRWEEILLQLVDFLTLLQNFVTIQVSFDLQL